jgi:choline dehydrogenase-like flavoprotein
MTGVHVTRLIIADGRATGIAYEREGETRIVKARAGIVLAGGAIGTPRLLESSGIGDGERLQRLDIPVIAHLPGVGENLQDHLQIRPVYGVRNARTLNVDYRSFLKRAHMAMDYAVRRRGPLTMAPSQVGIFARSSARYETPNLQFHAQPLSLDKFGDPLHVFPAITMSVCNLRPESRGSVHCETPDPFAAPAIRPNYLATPEDRRVAADALRLTRKICAARALAPYGPQELRPGAHVSSEEDLIRAAGDLGTTIFHPVGTARMGTDDDPAAVLDARLRLRGVTGLRVADASAMPSITSGNTNAPTMMIAERAAAMILADGGC